MGRHVRDIASFFATTGEPVAPFAKFLTWLVFLTSPIWAGVTLSLVHPILGAVASSFSFILVAVEVAWQLGQKEKGQS